MLGKFIQSFFKQKRLIYFLFTISFIFYCIILFRFININKKRAIDIVLKSKLDEETAHINVTIENIKYLMFHYIYHHILKENSEVIELFKKAVETKNKKERDEIRKKMYIKLLPLYQELKKIGITQIHFHTKDCKSFLRMDMPQKYGDDLKKARPSVVYVNLYKKPWFGFETGKFLPGFRYVVPLIIDGKHIGSMELVWRSTEIYKFLLKSHPNEYPVLIFKASLVKPKLFYESRKNYIVSPFGENWLLEKYQKSSKKIILLLQFLAKDKKFLKLLNTGKKTGYYFKLKDEYYSVVLIPFYNINKKLSAILLFLYKDNNVKTIFNIYKKECIFGSLGLILLYLLVLIIYHLYLRIEKERNLFKTLTDTLEAGIYIVKFKKGLIWANPMVSKILGYSFDEIKGKEPHYIFHADAKKEKPLEECPVFKTLKKGETFKADIQLIKKDGTLFWAYMISTPLFENGKITGGITIFFDITDRKKLEEKLHEMAITDPLTGLFNRREALNILKKEKAMADRGVSNFCLILLDIDNFKQINDTYGHDKGDEVLVYLASILKKNLRAYDIISRWGGEEFLVILPRVDLNGAIVSAERIRKSIETANINGVKITVSLGVTCYRAVETLNSLLKRVDDALYEAKNQGKNRIIIK